MFQKKKERRKEKKKSLCKKYELVADFDTRRFTTMDVLRHTSFLAKKCFLDGERPLLNPQIVGTMPCLFFQILTFLFSRHTPGILYIGHESAHVKSSCTFSVRRNMRLARATIEAYDSTFFSSETVSECQGTP